jgi:hypothetical protein
VCVTRIEKKTKMNTKRIRLTNESHLYELNEQVQERPETEDSSSESSSSEEEEEEEEENREHDPFEQFMYMFRHVQTLLDTHEIHDVQTNESDSSSEEEGDDLSIMLNRLQVYINQLIRHYEWFHFFLNQSCHVDEVAASDPQAHDPDFYRLCKQVSGTLKRNKEAIYSIQSLFVQIIPRLLTVQQEELTFPDESELAFDKPISSSSSEDSKELEQACIICTENKANCIAWPCAHLQFCVSCVRRIAQTSTPTCPTCKEPVQAFKRVFTN